MSITIKKGDIFTCKSKAHVVVNAYCKCYCDFDYYNVSYNGEDKFLVFSDKMTPDQKEKIKSDVFTTEHIPCSDWPVDYYGNAETGMFFYICDPMPKEYITVGDILAKGTVPPSLTSKIDIAILIADIFNTYSENGICVTYFAEDSIGVDINTGKPFINLYLQLSKTSDNAKPYCRFLPSEVLAGVEPFSHCSNRYLLSAVLFAVFFAAHPFEGKLFAREPFLTNELAENTYEKALFIMDPRNSSNRPDRFVQGHVEPLWNQCPQSLKSFFIKAFCPPDGSEYISSADRATPLEWLQLLTDCRSRLYFCAQCKSQNFTDVSGAGKCVHCGKTYTPSFLIKTYNSQIPVFSGGRIYTCQICENPSVYATKPVGIIVSRPSNPSELGIKNISDQPWKVITPSGNERTVATKEVVPMKNGLVIKTDRGSFSIIENASTRLLTFDAAPEDSDKKTVVPEADVDSVPNDDTSAPADDTATDVTDVADSTDEVSADVATPADNAPADNAPDGDSSEAPPKDNKGFPTTDEPDKKDNEIKTLPSSKEDITDDSIANSMSVFEKSETLYKSDK